MKNFLENLITKTTPLLLMIFLAVVLTFTIVTTYNFLEN